MRSFNKETPKKNGIRILLVTVVSSLRDQSGAGRTHTEALEYRVWGIYAQDVGGYLDRGPRLFDVKTVNVHGPAQCRPQIPKPEPLDYVAGLHLRGLEFEVWSQRLKQETGLAVRG